MGAIRETPPVKLLLPMFSGDRALFCVAEEAMVARFGPLDYASAPIPFTFTHYYDAEFGEALERRFLSFERLIDPAELAAIKVYTNDLEERLGENKRGRLQRRINLDPGYLSLGKLVLATTKDHAHRIYLGQGIFAEVTLSYRGGRFQAWPWTYPDYQSEAYRAVLREVRAIYAGQLKALARGKPDRR